MSYEYPSCIKCKNCEQVNTGSLYCRQNREWVKKDGPSHNCKLYENAYRSDYQLREMIKLYDKYFILTKINSILNENGKALDNGCLETFKLVYEHILPLSMEGQELISKYVTVGPSIAGFIECEYQNPETQKIILSDIENFYEKLIKVATSLAKDKKYNAAIVCYKSLITSFENRYGLSELSIAERKDKLSNQEDNYYNQKRI